MQGVGRRLALFESPVMGLLRKLDRLARLGIRNLRLQVTTFRFQFFNSVTGHETLDGSPNLQRPFFPVRG